MMIILCPVGFCGMTPKAGASVAAVYMILVTNIYLIFEVGHLERAMTDMAQIKPFNLTEVGKMLTYCYYTAITLAVMTYPVCVFLIYYINTAATLKSVQKRLYMGMFAYVAWITFYDLANCLIIALAYQVSKETWFSLSPLEWFGLATRIPMDCFWLSFIVKYALLVIESKGQGGLNASELPRFRLGSTARKGVRGGIGAVRWAPFSRVSY
ncbi:transmembrane protein 217-like [Malaclemys terrapin pileata]|uniref:transmembrane protein 217-like n=1 Tax=Malaclemys terrapin pileata TaxID=2991368 RepID=UPI0023A83073|nr:transmembrane protein 217-like [Malaclemys terrapin pileata]